MSPSRTPIDAVPAIDTSLADRFEQSLDELEHLVAQMEARELNHESDRPKEADHDI